MKSVYGLKKKRAKSPEGRKIMNNAMATFRRRKKKPHAHSKGKIRVHINKRYFDFAPRSKKWSLVVSSGMGRWHSSAGIDDFLEQAGRLASLLSGHYPKR